MRKRISTKRRSLIIAVSIVVFSLIIIHVVNKMTSITNSLKEDFSRAGIVCTDISIHSSSEISNLISQNKLNGISVSDELVEKIKSQEKEICILNLEYVMYFNENCDVRDFSMEIKNSEISDGEVHGFSNAILKGKTDTAYRLEQTVLMDKSCLRESFLEKNPPCSFTGQFDYKFSYFVDGREAPDTIAFSTAKKI